ncbi:hypothetical protein PAXRUDRAFT_92959, partial [Paxillus rubicundulus Ve08.2h10]
VEMDLQTSRQLLSSMKKTLTAKLSALGVEEERELKNLKASPYLCDRINARALKQHICDRLRQQKFELDRLQHDYRQTINEKKLHVHTQSALKHREPAITTLVAKYNSLCDKLQGHISSGSGPQQALVPKKISREGLFSLDVDDEIWQDVGLEDREDTGLIPAWLGDDEVRQGINNALELDQCVEEEKRLQRERCAMQDWMLAEWDALKNAQNLKTIMYQLHERQELLASLCAVWQDAVSYIPPLYIMPTSWGPSLFDIATAHTNQKHGFLAGADESDLSDSDDSLSSGGSEGSGEDAEFMDLVEELAMLD